MKFNVNMTRTEVRLSFILAALIVLNAQWGVYWLNNTPTKINETHHAVLHQLGQQSEQLSYLTHHCAEVESNADAIFVEYQKALRQNIQLRNDVNVLAETLSNVAKNLEILGIDPRPLAQPPKGQGPQPKPAKPKEKTA